MNLPQLKAYNRHYHSDLGHYFRPEEELKEEPRYNLRSHQAVGDFLIIHEESMNCPIVSEEAHIIHHPKLSKKSIMTKRNSSVTNTTMMDNILDFVSGDQLPSLMAGMQFHLDLTNEYNDLPVSAERYKYGKLLQCYKKGQLRQNMSNKLAMADIQPQNIKKEKRVKFSPSNLMHCYPETEGQRPQLLKADDITMSISAHCSLKETQCRAKQAYRK